jgi:hypothetical protein
MDEPYYPYERPVTEIRYDFLSSSQEKEVRKRVIFTTGDFRNFYNLALLDVLEDSTLSDLSESRNKDMKIIMSTVMRIVEDFFEANPEKAVTFKGSDERRQRLYRLIINRDLAEIQKEFVILGISEAGISEPFRPNQPYEFFVILKK